MACSIPAPRTLAARREAVCGAAESRFPAALPSLVERPLRNDFDVILPEPWMQVTT